MVRRFTFILFDTFMILVVFVQLFQFSGSNMNLGGLEVNFRSDNYFGFRSLFSFVEDLGNNTSILDAWNDFISWVTSLLKWVSDSISDSLEKMQDYQNGNPFTQFLGGLQLIFSVLVTPIILVLALGGFIVYIFRFFWELISLFFRLLLGYYNSKVITDLLSSEVMLCLSCVV